MIKRSVGFTFPNTRGKPKLTQLRGGHEESRPVSPHLERHSREDWGFHCTGLGKHQRNRALIVPLPALNYQSWELPFYLLPIWSRVAGGGNQTTLSHPVNSLENVSNSKACGILINTNSLGSSSPIFVTWAQPLKLGSAIHSLLLLFISGPLESWF